MDSKFHDLDVEVVFLANKGIIIGCFVGAVEDCADLLLD